MEPKLTLELTQAEAQNIVNLLDVATKAGGIQNARVALPLVEKIVMEAQKAFGQSQPAE
jgi:hypothetical protein